MTERDFLAALYEFGVTNDNILFIYSWGMGAVLLPWSLGFAVGLAKRVIAKA
jgi:hypothetical protein